MHPFQVFIQKYTSLPPKDWAAIEKCIRQQNIKSSETILEAGRICRYLYFLEKGLLRFFIVKEGNDVTKFFTVAPYTFTSQKSFNGHQPAKENIETIEDSILWVMTYENAQQLLEIPAWNAFVRKLTQEVQHFTEEILEDLQTLTAEERYLRLLNNQSDLLTRVPLKHIASYLGIAPQSLSRIRKKIAQSNRN